MLVQWERLLEEIRPYDPKAGRGRAPYELECMLRVHCVQLFYNLSDPATEDMLYEIESVRRFTGISLTKVPDETTILNFRHLLERHGLGQVLFERGLMYHSAEPVSRPSHSLPTVPLVLNESWFLDLLVNKIKIN